MARRTFADASAELLLRLGNRSDAVDPLREQWLNDAMYKCGMHYDHRVLQRTVEIPLLAGSDTFVEPTSMWWPEWLYNVTDGRPVTMGDRDLIEATDKQTTTPTRFYTWGNAFFFNSVAEEDKVIRLYYVERPVRWAGAAVLPYEENYDILVVMWATKIGLTALRDLEEAGAVGQEIGMHVSGMRFPLREQKKNDRLTGVQVKFR
jgi:hypothetical protein